MARFVVQTTYADMGKRKEARPRHLEYIRKLTEQGKIILAGPFNDQKGAMLIFNVEDEAEAQALIDADPYLEAGALASVDLREWTQIFPEL